MYALGITGLWLTIGVLISATATALLVSVLAQVYNAVPEEAALTAVVNNGLSILTLTGFVWLFQTLGMVYSNLSARLSAITSVFSMPGIHVLKAAMR